MASGMIVFKWQSYIGVDIGMPFFSRRPLTYNCKQKRLHNLERGDFLWLVSRNPDDKEYYIVGRLQVEDKRMNPSNDELAKFGKYQIIARESGSVDYGRKCLADKIVRKLNFETGKGVSENYPLGNSLQSIRFLNKSDEQFLLGEIGN